MTAAQSGHQKYLLSKLLAAAGTAAIRLTATYCIQKANATQRQPMIAAMMDGILVFIVLCDVMWPNDPKLSHGANYRKREFASKCKMKEQSPLAPARC
jgi:hypothetical protein